jgi:AP endonuclease-2
MPKSMAVPPSFDAFFSFPYGKGGYSGTCVYTKHSYLVPLKAEEGITGLLLDGPSSCVLGKSGIGVRSVDKIGGYPEDGDFEVVDEPDGGHFDLRRLDMEGRSVVLDFGWVGWSSARPV